MIHPFKAVRPKRDKAYLVATRSYISYTASELEDKLENNPYTFLHVINPSALAHEDIDTRFNAVRARYNAFWEEGIFLQDAKPGYYVYEQSTPKQTYRGIIGLLEADSVKAGATLPHEKTIAQREELFAHYLEKVGFQAEPVLVFGAAREEYHELLDEICADRAEYEFASTDKHVHKLWHVDDPRVVRLEALLKEVETMYIADGHHRLASSARVAERLNDNTAAQGVLTLFMDEKQVGIESFERWFKLDDQPFHISMLESTFDLQLLDGPSEDFSHCDFQMFFEGKWYGLSHISHSLDGLLSTQILLDKVLKPVLGVVDERNDSRLTYVRQTSEDQSRDMCALGYTLGFRVPAVPLSLLKTIAEEGGSMPPKSTYIEPKLRSGLILHDFT
ncbi:MAG: hypothetical protein RL754_527 [Bacteroidota bacterium]|jgi:uncharacterized protein (DUF1015 family)